MDCKTFFEKLWNILEKILPWILIVLVVTFGINSCNESGRYKQQLTILTEHINDATNQIESIESGLRSAGSTISDIARIQSEITGELESVKSEIRTTNDVLELITGTGDNINGQVGGIISDVNRLTTIIDTTYRGIEETGIQ